MHPLLRELVEPFDRMPPATASALLRSVYGLEPTGLELLDTERDDSFRVSTATDTFVLKVAHPQDPRDLIELQLAALERALEREQPVQRVVRTTEGRSTEGRSAQGGTTAQVTGRTVRLLSWLPGELLAGRHPTLEQVTALGAALGRLADALAEFEHPAAHRTFAWDLQSLAQLATLPHPPLADPVFADVAVLDLGALPHQVIHNDFHPGNLLVAPTEPRYVTGILDFGDLLYAPRIQDVAVALAYLLPERGDPAPTIAAFLAGYESITALHRAERAALPPLLAGRLVQRIMLPPLLGRVDETVTAALTATLETLRTSTI